MHPVRDQIAAVRERDKLDQRKRGPAIRALSSAQVGRIISRFRALNPYDKRIVPGSILELEAENFDPRTGKRRQLYGYAIAAKRYCLFNLTRSGEPLLRKRMEHGLGHLLNPTAIGGDKDDWISQLWEYIIRADALGLDARAPEWLSAPALTQTTISRPSTLSAFAVHNRGIPVADQVRPFNFLLAAHVSPGGHPNGADPTRFQLVAPYARDQRQWRKRSWFDLHTGDRYRITTHGSGGDAIARVNTYRDILDRYRIHPEAKSCDGEGDRCGPTTIGLLHRRPVNARLLIHVGKESNRLEEVQAGLTHDAEDVLTEYESASHGGWRTLVHPVLCDMPVALAARESGVSRRGIEKLRANLQQRPHAKTMQAVTLAAAEYARSALVAANIQASPTDFDCLAAYRDWRSALPGLTCQGCGRMLSGRQHRWCDDCASKRLERDRRTKRGSEATSARASRPTRSQAA
jgi:hypothetical protein